MNRRAGDREKKRVYEERNHRKDIIASPMKEKVFNPERIGMEICPSCKGFGRKDNEVCLRCGGFGFVRIVGSALEREGVLDKVPKI